jgi:Putative outer membrane beta-barrel porin, MtrB/PioB
MTRKPLSILIAGLFAAAPAMAQDLGSQWVHQGSVTLGGIWSDLDGRDDSRAEKYRDLGDGVLSGIELRSRGPGGMWLDLYGENFGRDDMYFGLRGGQWDAWKYRLYYDWVPQNRLFNGRTPYSGSGGNELRATFPRPNPDVWESVDIGYKRKDLGGYFEWQRNSPWYFRVDANQVVTEGTKIGAASNGTSPGNGFVDLAIPVDYTSTSSPSATRCPSSRTATRRSRGAIRSGRTASTPRTSRPTTTTSAWRSPARSASCRGTRRCRRARPGTGSRAARISPPLR